MVLANASIDGVVFGHPKFASTNHSNGYSLLSMFIMWD